jgi:hypothetical protein
MLSRTWWIVVASLVVVLGVLELAKPEPVNWKRTFLSSSTQPFGTWIAVRVLDSLTERPVAMIDSSSDVACRTVPPRGQWWVVAETFDPATEEIDSLFSFVHRGGHLVLATRWLTDTLQQQIGIDMQPVFSWEEAHVNIHDRGDVVHVLPITDDYLSQRFRVRPDTMLSRADSSTWHPMITVTTRDDAHDTTAPWMIAGTRTLGLGSVTILSSPELISNVAFLKDTSSAVARLVVPLIAHTDGPVVWDRYHNGSVALPTVGDILARSHSAQLAVVLVVVTGLMYVSTNSRRRQRAIPVIERVENTTAEFVRTVADLMQSTHDHAHVVRMRVSHLRKFCATVLHVPIVNIDTTTKSRLVAATGCDDETIERLFELIALYSRDDADPEMSSADMLRYSTILDTFYEKASR